MGPGRHRRGVVDQFQRVLPLWLANERSPRLHPFRADRPIETAQEDLRSFDARVSDRRDPLSTISEAIFGAAQDCSFSIWRLIKSSACSASLLARGLNLMAAPLFGMITRSNHTIRKRFTEM